MNEKIKAWWASLTPDKRRMVMTAGSLALLLGVLYLFLKAGPDKNGTAHLESKSDTNLLTGSEARTLGLESVGAELRDAQRKQRDLQAALQSLQKQASTKDDLKSLTQQVAALTQSLSNFKDDAAKAAGSPSSGGTASSDRTSSGTPAAGVSHPGQTSPDLRKTTGAARGEGASGSAPEPVESVKVRVFGEEEPQAANKAPTATIEGMDDVFLPAGSIISGVLLTGVDAPTGQQSKRDPIPALMRVKHEAILPNRFSADVRECFVVFGVTGDLSTERGLMRAETLSCIRNDGGVIEVKIDAFAMGDDGKAGVRGRLVSRNGSLVAKAAFSSFAEALSQIFRPVAISGLNTSPGGRTDFQAPDASQALEAAGYAGVGGAMHRLSEYFVSLADEMVPFVEIDTARPVEAVLLKGVRLKLRGVKS